MKPILIFRHIAVEGPGYLSQVLERHGLEYWIIAVDQEETIPNNLEDCSGLVLMGGPMSANDSMPWIDRELALIRNAVANDIPVLGHCLGGQLISKALGGTVGPNDVKEIGWHDVEIFREGVAAGWTENMPDRFTAFHWHGEKFSLPKGATPLLTNRNCANQAFVLGNTLALQCHVEMTADMVREWVELYREELRSPTNSVQSPDIITQDAEHKCSEMQQWADVLYERWLLGLKKD